MGRTASAFVTCRCMPKPRPTSYKEAAENIGPSMTGANRKHVDVAMAGQSRALAIAGECQEFDLAMREKIGHFQEINGMES